MLSAQGDQADLKLWLWLLWIICMTWDTVTNNWRLSYKKRIFMYGFLGWFLFLQDRVNFWQTDSFWHEKTCSIMFLLICTSLWEITHAKKSVLQAASLRLNAFSIFDSMAFLLLQWVRLKQTNKGSSLIWRRSHHKALKMFLRNATNCGSDKTN